MFDAMLRAAPRGRGRRGDEPRRRARVHAQGRRARDDARQPAPRVAGLLPRRRGTARPGPGCCRRARRGPTKPSRSSAMPTGSGASAAPRTSSAAGSRSTAPPSPIVGVGPRGFSGVWLESPVDVWVPLAMQPAVRYSQSFSADGADLARPWLPQAQIWWLHVVVRVPREQVAAAAAAFGSSLSGLAGRDFRVSLAPFGRGFSQLRQRFFAPLLALMVMAALVLLVACANVANVLLARAVEPAARARGADGARRGRGRLLRQLLTESVLLVGMSGAAAVLVGRLGREPAGPRRDVDDRRPTAPGRPRRPPGPGVRSRRRVPVGAGLRRLARVASDARRRRLGAAVGRPGRDRGRSPSHARAGRAASGAVARARDRAPCSSRAPSGSCRTSISAWRASACSRWASIRGSPACRRKTSRRRTRGCSKRWPASPAWTARPWPCAGSGAAVRPRTGSTSKATSLARTSRSPSA